MRHRFPTIGCLIVLGVLIYASLVPYDFDSSQDAVEARFERMWQTWPFVQNVRISGSDALSNLILYVPFGVLAAARCRLRRHRSFLVALAAPVAVAALASAVVEVLQLYSMTRVPSFLDWLLNITGTLVGALAGAIWGPAAWIKSIRWIRLRWSRRPVAVAEAILIILLISDAVAPFLPTILMKEVWRSLKRSNFDLAYSASLRPWHWWLMARVGVFAIMTALLAASSQAQPRGKWLRAGVLTACFVIGMELCKLMISRRHFDIAHVVFAIVGCTLAVLIGPVVAKRVAGRARLTMGIATLAIFVTYSQFFRLYHRTYNFYLEDVRFFISTIILCWGLTCMCRIRWRWLNHHNRLVATARVVAVLVALALAIEAVQVVISDKPSLGDLWPFAIGAAIGAWIRLPAQADRSVAVRTAC